jgi:hypothetical protein
MKKSRQEIEESKNKNLKEKRVKYREKLKGSKMKLDHNKAICAEIKKF